MHNHNVIYTIYTYLIRWKTIRKVSDSKVTTITRHLGWCIKQHPFCQGGRGCRGCHIIIFNNKTCTDPLGQVECFYFPPNTTSIYQPLDQGIIAVIKKRYKTRMLTQLVSAADNFDELQAQAEKIPNGRKGLSYGLLAHVLDAANLLKACWDELPASTVSAC